jgi:hypothetical protein
MEEIHAPEHPVFCSLAQHAHERRDADAAGEEHRGLAVFSSSVMEP